MSSILPMVKKVSLLMCLIAPFASAQSLINQGEVCFFGKDYKGWISIGCFSSSCTFQKERDVSVGVDLENGIINISSRVVLGESTDENIEEISVCTDDCGGVEFTFDFSGFRLAGKKYSVMYGDKAIGTLDTDFDADGASDRPVCFGNQYPITKM